MKISFLIDRFCGHSLFFIYSATLAWLLLSCLYFASSAQIEVDFVKPLLLFSTVFVLLYALLTKSLGRSSEILESRTYPLPERAAHLLIAVLFIGFSTIAVMHLSTLGYLPIIEAYQSTNDYEIARIRQQSYYNLAVWQRYASDYAIKGIGPILLVLAAQYRSRLFYPALVVGLIYTISLFVKANPVYLLLPLAMFFMLSGKGWRAVGVVMLMIVSVGLNWTSSSPPVRDDVMALLRTQDQHPRDLAKVPTASSMELNFPGSTVLASVHERLIIVPAQVTAQWYLYYVDPEQREKGCGYRVVARVIGCEYQHIPTKLHTLYYPDLVKMQGLTGSLNSGSYIHDFANFGYVGVLIGAIVFALLFTVLRLFCGTSPALLSLSLMPVLSLPEMPISTVLNSGGWLLIIFISMLLRYGGRLTCGSRLVSA
jgi:hypothetical protein